MEEKNSAKEEKKNKKMEKKLIKQEIKRKKVETKKKKEVEKKINDITKEKKEVYEIRRKRYIFEIAVVTFLVIILLILLCNRTFFKEEYRTKKIDLDIPLLTFFVKDDGKEIVFKTLRKSQYVKEFFDSYLENLTMYNCNGKHFYYDEISDAAIYDIKVEKTFAIKTITVKYDNGSIECLCASSVDKCK